MKVQLAAVFLASTVLAGCTALLEDGACVDASEARRLYDGAQDWLEDLGSTAFTMRLEGTIEGTVDTVVMSADPDDNAVHLESGEGIIVFEHPYYSIETGDLSGYGRDHDDRNTAGSVLDELLGEDLGVSFADDIQFSDYGYECATLGGLEVLRFHYEFDGTVDEFSVPLEGTPYPVSGRSVDPALQDNFRISVSLDPPRIRADDALERLPLTIDILGFAFEDGGDGVISSGILGAETEWVPFSELDLAVTEAETGAEWGVYELEPGEWELDEGYYILEDRDDNDLLSEGDYLEVGLAYDFDWELLDTWAGAYAFY